MRTYLSFLFVLVCGTGFAQEFQYSRKGQLVIEDEPSNTEVVKAERANLHFQTTYIYQYKPAFNATYAGPNSLSSKEDNENSLTATLYFGLRLWKGGQLYINPELAGGSGLSGALGMGGSSNGETFRVGNPSPTLYLARGYVQQTFELQSKLARKNGVLNTEQQESDANQLSGYMPKNYLRLYAGKFCLGDFFDNNEYANSPRTQFMNWALMNNGAWDYAANVRGYTLGFIAEAQVDKMNFKAGIAAMPTSANGPTLQTNLNKGYALNGEIVRNITINRQPGHIRLLGYYNLANMGNYARAIQIGQMLADTPNVDKENVNGSNVLRSKSGFGINFDQRLNKTYSVFARYGWNDGKNQTWCFTEIDRSLSFGLSLNGYYWKRPQDNFGVAILINSLSADHRDYLKKGGSGFILGDGTLSYANEFITEVYYSCKPNKQGIWVSGDAQLCMNPGYNSDRGPVNILSVRLHVEL